MEELKPAYKWHGLQVYGGILLLAKHRTRCFCLGCKTVRRENIRRLSYRCSSVHFRYIQTCMRSNVIQWYFDMLHWRNMNVCCWYIRLYLKKRKQKYLRVNETVNSMRSRFEPGDNLQKRVHLWEPHFWVSRWPHFWVRSPDFSRH